MLAKGPDITTNLGVDKEIADRMLPFLPQSVVSVRSLIGPTKYTELEGVDESSSAELQAEKASATHAEALHCFYHSAPFLNLRYADCGGIVRSTGFDESRVDLIRKRELDEYRGEAWEQSLLILGDLVLSDGVMWTAV